MRLEASLEQTAIRHQTMNFAKRLLSFFSLKDIFVQELRSQWGRATDVYHDPNETELLFNLTERDTDTNTVDRATWNDLDMDVLFARIDANVTPVGRQYLYRKLRTLGQDVEGLRADYQAAEHLAKERRLREKIQLEMYSLRRPGASAVTGLLFDSPPEGRFPRKVAYTLAGASVLTIAIAVVQPTLIWLPLVSFAVNFFFTERYSYEISNFSSGFVQLKKMLRCAHQLSQIEEGARVEQLELLKAHGHRIRKLRASFRLTGFDGLGSISPMAQTVFLLNVLCLFDFLVFVRSSRVLSANRSLLVDIYEAVASLDSIISLGSYITLIGDHCNPRFGPGTEIRFDSLVHPLIVDAVPNSFFTEGKSALITGSNMAGKTTFIKAIGINCLLAQTIWLCHARSAQVPMVPVMSSIRRADSLIEGKSYYLSEIESLLRFVEVTAKGCSAVFLIDEILRGTNTVERVAGSAAILSFLCRHSTVLATTHDIELAALLPAEFEMYHFRETADLNEMFDYKMWRGHCSTRNAIRLLEKVGFPDEIVERARLLAVESE